MITATMKTQGFKELDKALAELPTKVAKKHLTYAVRRGADIIRKAIMAKAPVKTGTLRKSFTLATRKIVGHSVTVFVRVKKEGWYWRLVEYGTKAHRIPLDRIVAPRAGQGTKFRMRQRKARGTVYVSDIRTKQVMLIKIGGSRFYASHIEHPGSEAKPFVRPAIDESKEKAIKELGRVLGARIEQEFSKAGRATAFGIARVTTPSDDYLLQA